MIAENSNLELRENRALDYFQHIVESVREPLVILDSELRVHTEASSFISQGVNITDMIDVMKGLDQNSFEIVERSQQEEQWR